MKKSVVILILTVLFGLNLFAQEISREEWKNMSSSEKKEYKEKMMAESRTKILTALTSQAWVLEAHTLQDRYGESFIIEPSLNFVGISGEHSTIQLGESGEIGFNGVGGITLDGEVTKHEVREGKKANSSINVKLQVSGSSSGFVTILLNVSPDGSASAMVSDMQGNRITYRGQFNALGESNVYKGTTNYL